MPLAVAPILEIRPALLSVTSYYLLSSLTSYYLLASAELELLTNFQGFSACLLHQTRTLSRYYKAKACELLQLLFSGFPGEVSNVSTTTY